MSTKVLRNEPPEPVGFASEVIAGTLTVTIRAVALVMFLALSLAEPVVAFLLCGMALGCFSVAVLFGFIFHAYFPHRWFVLGASDCLSGALLALPMRDARRRAVDAMSRPSTEASPGAGFPCPRALG